MDTDDDRKFGPKYNFKIGLIDKENPFQWLFTGKDGRQYLKKEDLAEWLRGQENAAAVVSEINSLIVQSTIDRYVERRKAETAVDSGIYDSTKEWDGLQAAVRAAEKEMLQPGIGPRLLTSFEDAQARYKWEMFQMIPKEGAMGFPAYTPEEARLQCDQAKIRPLGRRGRPIESGEDRRLQYEGTKIRLKEFYIGKKVK